MSGRLAGRIALITGVGGGIGAAAASRFAAEGARVAGCDLDESAARHTGKSVRAEGGEITVAGGVADPPERLRKVVLDRIPLGRHGRCDDVVNAALYLASDESAWVSGANLVVDGGGSALG